MLGALTPSKFDIAAKADETGLRSELIHIIKNHAANAPRNVQRAIGPSQVGTPCARRLAFEMSDLPPTRDVHDPWPSIMGTAGHTWLADCFEEANRRVPGTWLVEHRVDVGLGLRGSSDVFHIPSGCVIDWKILGDTMYRQYTGGEPSETYKRQAHCYGLGFQRMGYTVNRVAIAFLKRAGKLSDLYVWSEPFDLEKALRTLQRMQTVQRLLASGVHPMRIPAEPGGHCYFCAFKTANNGADGYCER